MLFLNVKNYYRYISKDWFGICPIKVWKKIQNQQNLQ